MLRIGRTDVLISFILLLVRYFDVKIMIPNLANSLGCIPKDPIPNQLLDPFLTEPIPGINTNTSKIPLNIKAIPENDIQLFTRPAWKCIPFENQKKAKKLLEDFVEQAKAEKNAGTGIQLIAVCKYLTEKKVEKMQSLQNRMEPLTILFVDHERIVFGVPASQKKSFNSKEYGIKISFSINKGPISAREIFVTGIVNKIYQNEENDDICVDFRYSNMQEEDLRFLYEKATSTLFD